MKIIADALKENERSNMVYPCWRRFIGEIRFISRVSDMVILRMLGYEAWIVVRVVQDHFLKLYTAASELSSNKSCK